MFASRPGTVNAPIASDYDVTGITSVDGIVDFTGTVESVGQTLDVEGGAADFGSTPLNVQALDVGSGGTLIAGDVTTSSFWWYGGTVGGTGKADRPPTRCNR